MARKRMIDPNIWQSEDFSKLSTLAKLVFIGLFSLADDEGKGKSNPMFLKSTLFPYEENIRSADIDKTLSEISSNMSVTFYSYDGSNYYSLYNWNAWQKIDRPSQSKILDFDEKSMSKLFDDNSTNIRREFVPNKNKNIKEKEKNKKVFIAPSLDEVESYVKEKGLTVNAKSFYDYFSTGNWKDSKGNEVKNWKQKILTWNNYSKNQIEAKNKTFEYNQNNFNDWEEIYDN